jgi:hypothetical protein
MQPSDRRQVDSAVDSSELLFQILETLQQFFQLSPRILDGPGGSAVSSLFTNHPKPIGVTMAVR